MFLPTGRNKKEARPLGVSALSPEKWKQISDMAKERVRRDLQSQMQRPLNLQIAKK